MKNFKALLTLLLVSGALLINVSCDKEENDDYYVAVDIIAPENGTVVQKGTPFSVEVDFTRVGEIIHNVKVEILNANGHSMMKLVEKHVHEADNFKFTQDNIVIDQTGTYTLRAFTSDMHEGEEHEGEHGEEHGEDDHEKEEEDAHNTVEVSFTVQ